MLDISDLPHERFSRRSPTLIRTAPGSGSADSHRPVTDFASSPPRLSLVMFFWWRFLMSWLASELCPHLEDYGYCSIVRVLTTSYNAWSNSKINTKSGSNPPPSCKRVRYWRIVDRPKSRCVSHLVAVWYFFWDRWNLFIYMWLYTK